jgi:hypothetical protein
LRDLVANHILDIIDADEDVFRLEVGVDNAAAPVHVVQAEEDLLADLAHEPNRDALGLVPLDEAEEILSQDLEDHANMDTIWTLVLEVVEERDDVRAPGVGLVGRDEALEELDFVERGLGVAGSGLDDLESDVAVHPGLEISTRSSRQGRKTHLVSFASQTVEKWPQLAERR